MWADGPDDLQLLGLFVVTFLATIGFWALVDVIAAGLA